MSAEELKEKNKFGNTIIKIVIGLGFLSLVLKVYDIISTSEWTNITILVIDSICVILLFVAIYNIKWKFKFGKLCEKCSDFTPTPALFCLLILCILSYSIGVYSMKYSKTYKNNLKNTNLYWYNIINYILFSFSFILYIMMGWGYYAVNLFQEKKI